MTSKTGGFHTLICRTVSWKALLSMMAASLLIPFTSPAEKEGKDYAWREVLELIGADVPEDRSVSDLLGPLPGATAHERARSLTPREFMSVYERSSDDVKLIMRRSARSRLRELYRAGAVDQAAVAALIGPEGAGVSGSRFFGIPPIPEESFRALISYMEFAALSVPGGGFEVSRENREKIDRALHVSFAISSAEVRTQYWGFDAVWSLVLMHYFCGGRDRAMLPGILWLYKELREHADLGFLAGLDRGLSEEVEAEGGALFAGARREIRRMPASLAAVTLWECDAN